MSEHYSEILFWSMHAIATIGWLAATSITLFHFIKQYNNRNNPGAFTIATVIIIGVETVVAFLILIVLASAVQSP